MQLIKIFVDASYSKELKTAVCGTYIPSKSSEPTLTSIQCNGIATAEKKVLHDAILLADELKVPVTIFTDHEGALKNLQTPASINVQILKGHKKKADKDEDDIAFTVVDKAVRRELRRIVKSALA